MKWVRYSTAFILIAVLQTTFCHLISIKGAEPDLVLCFLLYLAVKEGALAGVYGGFIMGLVFDVYSPQVLGAGCLVKSVTGYLAGFLDERNITLDEKFKLPVIFIAALFHHLFSAALLFGFQTAFQKMLLVQILPSAAYTTLAGGLFLLVSYWRR